MRLVVIGSNSFTGSHVVARALQSEHTVLAISRSPEPSAPFLPRLWAPRGRGDFRFLQADLNDDSATIVKEIREFEPDVVVNFAAQSMVAQSWSQPEHWYRTNVVALASLVSGLQGLPSLRLYVHFTTPEVYGSTRDWITENYVFSPSTPYAVSRAAGDWHLLATHTATGFPVVFTRAANVYGPGQQLYRIVPKAILSALLGRELPLHGGGESRRSFIHIDDVVTATLGIAERGVAGTTYHISTSELVSIRELVFKSFEAVDVDAGHLVATTPDRLGKDAGYFLDSSRLRTELGWSPEVQLDEGLATVAKWAKDNLDQLGSMPLEYTHRP
jgi:dTDP-glucose 4,6-dehydratase